MVCVGDVDLALVKSAERAFPDNCDDRAYCRQMDESDLLVETKDEKLFIYDSEEQSMSFLGYTNGYFKAYNGNAGRQLRKLLKRRGITQVDLSEMLNVSSKTVQRYCWGLTPIPARVMDRICWCLNVPMTAFEFHPVKRRVG